MELQVNTQMKILKPAHDIFEAILDPGKMSKYFISKGSGRLEEEKIIIWTLDDYGSDAVEIKVTRIDTDRLISFIWTASGMETIVEITLDPQSDTATLVRIRENGWKKTDKGIVSLVAGTQRWVGFLFCLKTFLEYGISLGKDRGVRETKKN